VGILTVCPRIQDEDEDWSRWRDVVFRAKGALIPQGIKMKSLPPQNRRERGGPAFVGSNTAGKASLPAEFLIPQESPNTPAVGDAEQKPPLPQLSSREALERLNTMTKPLPPMSSSAGLPSLQCSEHDRVVTQEGNTYCPECYLPLHPDPKPERLYIFLHALRYTTSLGCFETEIPEWAAKGWVWDRS
jgi:tRNA pseudouridine synthase 9